MSDELFDYLEAVVGGGRAGRGRSHGGLADLRGRPVLAGGAVRVSALTVQQVPLDRRGACANGCRSSLRGGKAGQTTARSATHRIFLAGLLAGELCTACAKEAERVWREFGGGES